MSKSKESFSPPPVPTFGEDAPPMPPLSSVPHIEATYKGFYYKAGVKGNEKTPFMETIKVPLKLLLHPKRSSIGVFRDLIGPKIMEKHEGFSGICKVYLHDNGPLPSDLPLHKKLDWTGSFAGLAEFAKVQTPEVIPGLYNNASELRHAIRVCLQDPKGFAHQQEKGAPIRQDELDIAQELADLGY